ncbi:hypothetical protein CEB3_c43850 [Peptococcaceae bacterium CEB3]|nr:hypothetical protein CEB3_c43850 [Peptococcaceae bacterium CEB3]
MSLLLWFLVSFFVYNLNLRVITSGDNLPTRLLPMSIIEQKSVFLDSYFEHSIASDKGVAGLPWYSLRKAPEHVLAEKSTGYALTITPLYWIGYELMHAAKLPHRIDSASLNRFLDVEEKILASFFAGLSVALLYLLCTLVFSKPVSFVATLIYAFGTNHWVTSSQGLWVNGGEEFWLVAALLFVTLFERSRKKVYFFASSIAAGLVYAMRPTGALFLLMFCAYFFVYHRRYFVEFLLPLGTIVTAYSTFNLLEMGGLIGGYSSIIHKPFWAFGLKANVLAFLGLFFSPGRGLFFYSPILILSFVGVYRLIRKRELREQHKLLLWSIGATFLIVFASATYTDNNEYLKWYGGYGWGPRYLVDVLPLLVLYAGVGIDEVYKVLKNSKTYWRYLVVTVGVLLFTWSVFTQVVGAFYYKSYWDTHPVSIDRDPQRVWDLRNNPIAVELETGLAPVTRIRLGRILGIYVTPKSPLERDKLREYIILSDGAHIKDIHPNQDFQIPVTIGNSGAVTLPCASGTGGKYQVNFSYHWVSPKGKMVVFDGLRTNLPGDLRPNQTVKINAQFQAPRVPGKYILKFDLVQEDAFWFSNTEAKSKGILVDVQ